MTMLGVLIPWVLMTRVSLIRFTSLKPTPEKNRFGDRISCLNRMNKFLNREELKEETIDETMDPRSNIAIISDGAFSWSSNEPPFLRDINMEVAPGQLLAVVGRVGSGKSSLLAALLGELKECAGNVVRCRNTAYLPQQAWVQNCSIRENILFCQVFYSGCFTQSKYVNEGYGRGAISGCAGKMCTSTRPGCSPPG